jgi:hypothetical protein
METTMIELVLGAIIGGSVTFLLTAMLLSSKKDDYIDIKYIKGVKLTYVNKSGDHKEATVHQTAKSDDKYIVLMSDNRPFPFIVDASSITNL